MVIAIRATRTRRTDVAVVCCRLARPLGRAESVASTTMTGHTWRGRPSTGAGRFESLNGTFVSKRNALISFAAGPAPIFRSVLVVVVVRHKTHARTVI
jgi:hypothetical protein